MNDKTNGVTVKTLDDDRNMSKDADIIVIGGANVGMALAMLAMDVMMADSECSEEVGITGFEIFKDPYLSVPRAMDNIDLKKLLLPDFKNEDPGAKARRLFDPPRKSQRKRKR